MISSGFNVIITGDSPHITVAAETVAKIAGLTLFDSFNPQDSDTIQIVYGEKMSESET